MAHSFIEAHDHEEEAFRHFIASRPESVTLLIDTYDTRRAAHRVVALARELERRNAPPAIRSVRIDSGDLAAEARAVRAILDSAGYPHIQVLLSGGLDEYRIEKLVREAVPVNGFGVGTAVDASDDAPTIDMAYKLQQYAGKPRRKRSLSKVSLPGAKQVFRERKDGGEIGGDWITLDGEHARGEALLSEVMRDGKRVAEKATLKRVREYCAGQLKSLPAVLQDLYEAEDPVPYPVEISQTLSDLVASMDAAGD
jgi:nicotinate phosphoribosyltransferase